MSKGAWLVSDSIPFYDLPNQQLAESKKAAALAKLKGHIGDSTNYQLEYREDYSQDGTWLMAWYAYELEINA